MIFFLVLVFELLVLFFTSKFIFQALFLFSYKIFRKKEIAAIPIFILFLPGVVIHELAHFLAAEVLFVKTYDFEVSPKIEHGNFKMGSVQIQKTDMVRSFLIGAAPLVFGSAILLIVLYYYLNFLHPYVFNSYLDVLKTAGVIWVVFFITNTMFSSKKDMEGSLVLLIILLFLALVIILAAFLLKADLATPILKIASQPYIANLLKFVTFLFLWPVAINSAIFLAAKFILKN